MMSFLLAYFPSMFVLVSGVEPADGTHKALHRRQELHRTGTCLVTCFLSLWLLQEGKTWITSGCTQSCNCTGGAIQCQNFQCPLKTYCKDLKDGSSNCTNIRKGAMARGGEGVLMAGESRGKARRSLVVGIRSQG